MINYDGLGQGDPSEDSLKNYSYRSTDDYTTFVDYADSTPLTTPGGRETGHDESRSKTDPPGFRQEGIELLSTRNQYPSGNQSKYMKTRSSLPKANFRQRWSQWIFNAWIFELLSLLVSAICLLGIMLTLSLHIDHPLPRWPFSITINALISTLATISKSALLVSVTAAISQRKWTRLLSGDNYLYDLEIYDEASRGPWGSVSLLLSSGWRYLCQHLFLHYLSWSLSRIIYSDLASLGALITILSLAMDPFMQQITSFENVPRVIGHTNISARVIFETGALPTGGFFPFGFAQTPASFRPLVTQGLYFDGNLSDPFIANALQLRPESSGGNASFGNVETLAICSECADITEHLSVPIKSQQCDPDQRSCTVVWIWSLPNKASTGWTSVGDRSTMVIATNKDVWPLKLDNSGRLTVLNLTTIVPGWIYHNNTDPWATGTRGVAQECSLYWCVNNYDTKLSGGILNENLTSSFDQGYLSENPNQKFFYIEPPGSNTSYFRNDSMAYGDYPGRWINGSFLINTAANELVTNFSKELLGGFATSLGYYDPGAAISSNPSLLRLYDKVEWDANNITHFDMEGIFKAMAQGMTTAVRKADITHPDTDALLIVNCTETAMEVIFKVNWKWIILPVLLQIAANVFVFAVLIASKRKHFSTWKSSALAVMFFGMEVADKVPHEGIKDTGEMRNIAHSHKLPSK
jgi:hypothetical protein